VVPAFLPAARAIRSQQQEGSDEFISELCNPVVADKQSGKMFLR
jgi:hypothetical protein